MYRAFVDCVDAFFACALGEVGDRFLEPVSFTENRSLNSVWTNDDDPVAADTFGGDNGMAVNDGGGVDAVGGGGDGGGGEASDDDSGWGSSDDGGGRKRRKKKKKRIKNHAGFRASEVKKAQLNSFFSDLS